MANYEWSEVFMSIEGEARWAGHPTVYIRFARCNFQCRGFNNPGKDIQPDGYATLGFDPKNYKTLQEIPLVTTGCDSQYAVNPKFAHMWHKGDEKALAAEVLKVLPNNSFVMPSGKSVILSLTGGEPTIRIKFWIPILEELYAHGMRKILIETNCAAPLRAKDVQALYQWARDKESVVQNMMDRPREPIKIIWSNSPKLTSSGEVWEDAIRPEIALAQHNTLAPAAPRNIPGFEQYFKFVCGPNEEDFAEVEKAMRAYYDAGIIQRWTDVYIMPVACTTEQQDEISAKVAKMCIERGYIYCHRVQMIFGNGVGT